MATSNKVILNQGKIIFENNSIVYGTISADDSNNIIFTSAITVNDDLDARANIYIRNNAELGGNLILSNLTESIDLNSGSIVTEGGIAIKKNVNIGGDLSIDGKLIIKNILQNGNIIYVNHTPYVNDDGGMAIKKHVDNIISDKPVETGLFMTPGFNDLELEGIANDSDNYYVGWYIKVIHNTCDIEVREIVEYEGISRTVVLDSDLTKNVISNNTKYYLYNKVYNGLIYSNTDNQFVFCSISNNFGQNINESGLLDIKANNGIFDAEIVATSLSTSSDMRLKTDIKKFNESDIIPKLNVVSFKWNKKDFPKRNFDDITHIGFIAQEVEEVLPSIVKTNKTGFKSVEYDKLTPVLVKEVQNLRSRVEQLEKKIHILNKKF